MPSRDPARRFQDIIDNIDLIVERTAGMTKEEFFADPDKYDATERRLSRISEAANKLGLLAEQLEPEVPWNNIRGIGNWLRHDYPKVVRKTICRPCASTSRRSETLANGPSSASIAASTRARIKSPTTAAVDGPREDRSSSM